MYIIQLIKINKKLYNNKNINIFNLKNIILFNLKVDINNLKIFKNKSKLNKFISSYYFF